MLNISGLSKNIFHFFHRKIDLDGTFCDICRWHMSRHMSQNVPTTLIFGNTPNWVLILLWLIRIWSLLLLGLTFKPFCLFLTVKELILIFLCMEKLFFTYVLWYKLNELIIIACKVVRNVFHNIIYQNE